MALQGASDHGVSEALYLTDPDGNGIELYRDRPREEWPRTADGRLQMVTGPLDLEASVAGGGAAVRWPRRRTERRATLATYPAQPGTQQLVDWRRRSLPICALPLLNLHKALLDDARAAYELDRGSVGSSANLLQLVISDPWFAWLHSVSELIVRIDETLAADSPATDAMRRHWPSRSSGCSRLRKLAKDFSGATSKRCSGNRRSCWRMPRSAGR